jgi:hypothetical protein
MKILYIILAAGTLALIAYLVAKPKKAETDTKAPATGTTTPGTTANNNTTPVTGGSMPPIAGTGTGTSTATATPVGAVSLAG